MNYYAIERSTDYIEHYGIKGMRWGVRRAIQSGNDKKLEKQYKKAQKKLKKLSQKADPVFQRNEQIKYEKASKGARTAGRVALGIATAGTGLISGVNHIYKPSVDKKQKQIEKYKDLIKQHSDGLKKAEQIVSISEKSDLGLVPDNFKKVDIPYHTEKIKEYSSEAAQLKNKLDKSNALHDKVGKVGKMMQAIGAGGAIGSYGYALSAKVKANKAKNRISGKGHDDAVADRDAWKKEMQRAFKGTKYDVSIKHKKKQKRS